MKRLSVLLIACMFLASVFVAPFAVVAQRRPAARRPQRPQPLPVRGSVLNARFNQIADAYLRGYYLFHPTEATALGLHEYDRMLESRNPERVEDEVRRLRRTLAELARIWEGSLAPESRYDYLVLASHARAQLLELEEIRMWQRDPNIYNRLVAASIDNILKRNYAPIEQRLDAVLAREREINRLLGEARVNLQTPPRIYTQTAITQARGSIDYFTRVVPQLVERAGGAARLNAARRAEFEAQNQSVIASLRSFAEWLERDLLPRSTGDFAIGAENYRRKLLYEEMVDTPLAQLIRDGERELRQTQERMRDIAEEVAPGRGLIFALGALGREHPTADGLVGETRAELDRIRAFIRTQNIVTPPERENLIVAETPEYARSLSFGSLDPSGPFERVATEAYYYVTPPDPNWDEQRKEEHLRNYNRYALLSLSIHEALPGHYYQFLALKRSMPSRVRATFGSGSFIEGWAHYCEQMMLDEGFGGNNPKLRLAQLHRALRRLCRYLVGLRLHTAGMTYEDAVEFFMREGYEERVNAEREARRGTMDPTYLVYTLGKMQIIKLREEWQQRMGASFRLAEFHDRLLSYGMPPLKIVRLAMLGSADPDRTPASASVEDQTNAVDFSVLATGTMSGHQGGRSIQLITNENDWARVWSIIGNNRPTPEINFDTRAVIVAYQGQKPTGGWSISIAGVRREGRNIIVRVNEQAPGRSDLVTQALTSPFVAVSIPRPPGGALVRFDEDGKKAQPNRDQRKPNRRARGPYKPRARP